MDDFDLGNSSFDSPPSIPDMSYTPDPTPVCDAPAYTPDLAPCIVPDSNQGQDANQWAGNQPDVTQVCDPQQPVEHHHHVAPDFADSFGYKTAPDPDISEVILINSLQQQQQFDEEEEERAAASTPAYRGAQPFFPPPSSRVDRHWDRPSLPIQEIQIEAPEQKPVLATVGLASAAIFSLLGLGRLAVEAVTWAHGGTPDTQNVVEGVADLLVAGAGLNLNAREPGERGAGVRWAGGLLVLAASGIAIDTGIEAANHLNTTGAVPIVAKLAEELVGAYGGYKIAHFLNHNNAPE